MRYLVDRWPQFSKTMNVCCNAAGDSEMSAGATTVGVRGLQGFRALRATGEFVAKCHPDGQPGDAKPVETPTSALTVSAAVSGVTGASLFVAGLYRIRRKR